MRLRLLILILLPAIAFGQTVYNVKNAISQCGASANAAGNGTTNDTAAINSCISHLGTGGDTLEFPAGTYLVTSISVNKSNVTIDGTNNSAVIISKTTQQGPVLTIGQSGLNSTALACSNWPGIGAGSGLSVTANETSTNFTTSSPITGIGIGGYVLLMQGGADSSGGSGNTGCDTSGCRSEFVKITGVSGSTYTVDTMLHDTWNPSVNGAIACAINGVISNVTLQNITIDGGTTTAQTAGNSWGVQFNTCYECFIDNVTIRNVLGSALLHTLDYGGIIHNLTVTGAGSENCGAAAQFYASSDMTINTLTMQNLNPGTFRGSCLGDGAFGFEQVSGVNNILNNITVNSAGTGGGRPWKFTDGRWNTETNDTIENGTGGFNGIAPEYYSSHNLWQNCAVLNNSTGSTSGTAGINSFGNYNQYNTYYNCTITGNGGVQFYLSNYDALKNGQDQNASILGGTFGSAPVGDPQAVLDIAAQNFYITGAKINGPGPHGILFEAPNASGGTSPGGVNGCVNSVTFCNTATVSGTAISPQSSDSGTGNTYGSCSTGSLSSTPSCPSTSQGSGPLATLNVPSLNFSNQLVTTTSSPQTVTLTNGIGVYNGTNTLTFVSTPALVTGTQFAITGNTCTTTVSAGSTCTVTVTFTPTAAGAQSDTIRFIDNGGGAYQTLSVTGVGTSGVTLPQNWVNNNECNTNYTYELQFPGTWISATPAGWPTTLPYANTAAGLQQAITDLDTYRNSSGSGTRLDIPPGVYSQAGGFVINKTGTTAATQCNLLVSTQDSSLPNGRTVCAHGIQDNLATSTDPGLDNADCAGDAMYYQLGTMQTTVPAGAFTFANGTVTNTSAFNDVQYMYTLEGSGTTPTAMRFCSPTSTNGASGTPPPCTSTTLAPDHWLIEDMEARIQAGDFNSQDIISMPAAGNEPALSQYPQHVHFRKDWAHGDWTTLAAGLNAVSNAFNVFCVTCSIVDSQTSQNLHPGTEGHSVNTQGQVSKFVHNWFEGQSIGMLAGGVCSAYPVSGYVAFVDIEERRNRFTFPYAWLGIGTISGNAHWNGNSIVRKNGNEFKEGERVLRQGNIIENVDNSGGQGGPAGDVKTANNSCSLGTNYQAATSDVTDDSNIWRNACQAFQLVRSPSYNTSGVTYGIDRYAINNSLWYNISGTNYGCSTNTGISINFDAWEWQGTVTENAGGTQATFTATCSIDQGQCIGQIGSFTVNTAGTGCTAGSLTIGAPNLTGGRQAKGTYTCSGGGLSTATVTNFGSGYTAAPTVSLATGNGTLTANVVASSTAPGTGYATFDLNAGDPVAITQCSSVTAFNQATTNHSNTWLPSGIGPNAVSTTTLTATIPWTATANATDTAGYCKLSNIQGFPRSLLFTHNTVISDSSFLLTWGNSFNNNPSTGPNFEATNLFQNDLMIGSGGINNSPLGEGNPTINYDFDTTTLTLDHTVWPGRTASIYTAYGNNPTYSVASPVIYLGTTPSTSYCTGASPTSACVGFLGALSAVSMPLSLPDYHNFGLAAGSSFKNGASDGTDVGVNITTIDAAQTSTLYTCPTACASGPYPDNPASAVAPPSNVIFVVH